MSCLLQVSYDDLTLYERCGSGTYGSVYRAYWKSMDKEIAVKKLLTVDKEVSRKKLRILVNNYEMDFLYELLNRRFYLQAEVLSKISHRNIVQFYGIVSDVHNHCIVMGRLC